MPVSSNLPSRLLSLVIERSPSKTWINTVGWLSAAVEKLTDSKLNEVAEQLTEHLHLRLLSRDDSVAGNQLGHDTTGSLDTESKRADINKDDVFSVGLAGKDSTLDSRTVSNSLIRVNSLGRLLATKVFLKKLLHLGDTSGTTDKDDLYRQY